MPLSVRTVCSRYGTTAINASRKRTAVGLLVQSNKGEFRRSVDRDEQVELAFCCAQFGDIDVEITDRIGFEFLFGGDLVLDLRQARDAVPFQAAMQRGSGQVRDRRLQRIEAVVER